VSEPTCSAPSITKVLAFGVVTGLKAEAKLWGPTVLTASGAGPKAALAAAQSLIAQGASALMSFGVCAGLSPALRPGVLVLASNILGPADRNRPTDLAWRNRLASRLTEQVGPIVVAPILGSDRPVVGILEKAALYQATGAAALDMESHAVADAASAANLRFISLRAVIDAADQAVPEAALAGFRPDGKLSASGVVWGLLKSPNDLGDLIRLAGAAKRARESLGRVASLGAAVLGPE
jgi:adenosylhomocysteine nucleosidase